MDVLAISLVVFVLLALGTVVARWWWGLARKAMPYQDEMELMRERARAARRQHASEVVVIRESDLKAPMDGPDGRHRRQVEPAPGGGEGRHPDDRDRRERETPEVDQDAGDGGDGGGGGD